MMVHTGDEADLAEAAATLADLEHLLSEYAGMKYLLTHYSCDENWRHLLRNWKHQPQEEAIYGTRVLGLCEFFQSHPADAKLIDALAAALESVATL